VCGLEVLKDDEFRSPSEHNPRGFYEFGPALRLGREGETTGFYSCKQANQQDSRYSLEDGRIIENGHHDELVRRGETYARLFETQAQYYR
jgi:hypothetical protein